MLWGADISDYQPDMNLERATREGLAFVIIKSTEGASWRGRWFRPHLERARQAGLLTAAYHYQRPDSIASQVANVQAMVPTDVPVIPDVEKGSGSIGHTRALVDALRAAGYRVPLAYIPEWYWRHHLDCPDLAGLPPLWSSRYANYKGGTVWDVYNRNGGWFAQFWGGYGGLPIAILQHTSASTVAGRSPVDGNAYRGDRAQLAALLNQEDQEDDMPLSDEDIGRIAHRISNWGYHPGPYDEPQPNERCWVQSWETRNGVHALLGQITGLTEALGQLSQGQELDLQAVKQAAQDGVTTALREGTVTVDVDVTGPHGGSA